MSVDILRIARLSQQKENQKRNTLDSLMTLFEENALRTDTNEEYDIAIGNIQKLQGQDKLMDMVGLQKIKKLELEKQYNDDLKAWNTKADSVYNQIKTKDIGKTDFLDLMKDLRDNGIRVSGKSTRVEIQGVEDKIKNIHNMRKALNVEHDTQLLKATLQNPKSKLYGTESQRQGADVLSQLKSESPVEELKAEVSSNIFSRKDMVSMDERTRKKIEAYGPAFYIGKNGEGMDMLDRANQGQEVTADIIGRANKVVGNLDFSIPLTFATEKAGDTKVNRASRYYPSARKQIAKSYIMPFFTGDFRNVIDEHLNKVLASQGFNDNDIQLARGGDIATPERRKIAEQLAVFNEDSFSDQYIDTAIDLMDQYRPADQYNKFFSKMITDKHGKTPKTERSKTGPVMKESYLSLKKNYQNWKRLSDEYDKMDPSLQAQPNKIPDMYMDMNAVDIDQFNEMLAPE